MDSIGNRLFELRKKQGITQEKLAEQLNVSRQSVSKACYLSLALSVH